MSTLKFLTRLSAFGHLERGLAKQTSTGGLITLVFGVLAVILAGNEILSYIYMVPTNTMEVDVLNREEMRLQLDITMPRMPCSIINVMLLEASGGNPIDTVGHHLHKQRLSKHGWPLGQEPERLWQLEQARKVMPSEQAIMKDLSDEFASIAEEARSQEGCRIYGEVSAPRLTGALELTAGLHPGEVLQRTGDVVAKSDVSHTINKLRFGQQVPGWEAQALEGVRNIATVPGSYEYFIQVVPVKYHGVLGNRREGTQYSVQEYFVPMSKTPRLPCIIFEYDFYPIAVGIDHAGGVGLLHFLVRLCAVVGGCVALARATDHVVHFVQTTARKWLS